MDLEEIIRGHIKSYDELGEMLDEYLNGSSSLKDDDDDLPVKPKKKDKDSSKKKKKKKKEKNYDYDDDLPF